MSSNKKRFSLGWVVGISLGLACSAGVVNASSIADSYATGDTLTAAKMTAVKTAVNDNDTRITAIQAGTAACLTGMTKVGPICVDTVRQAAGTTWSVAVNTCRTANKRLLTPGEYMAAKNQSGAALGMNTSGEFEWVDSVASDAATDTTLAGGYAGRMTVGYMGPGTVAVVPVDGDIFFATNAAYDAGFAYIYFRCAR